jgi:hypothetical protein
MCISNLFYSVITPKLIISSNCNDNESKFSVLGHVLCAMHVYLL